MANEAYVKMINLPQMQQMFDDLQTKIQNRVIVQTYTNLANRIIKPVAVSNLQGVYKGKSKNNLSTAKKSWRVEKQNPEKGPGVKAGFKYYKLNWLNSGTAPRQYTSKKKGSGRTHFTGSMKATGFWDKAVEATQDRVQGEFEKYLNDQFEKTVAKYNKT
jgi:hypothetical protein